ncbi:MAG TPA: hypothetical protein VGI81_29305 [Tepidisphaeraceae bacterium]|jgi:hypothetical protein
MTHICSARARPATQAAVWLIAVLFGAGGCTFYSAARVPDRQIWALSGSGITPPHPAAKPMSLPLQSGRLEFADDRPAAVRFSDGRVLSLKTPQISAQALRELGAPPADLGMAIGGSIIVTSLLSAALDRLPPALADEIQSRHGPRRDQAARLAREILADEPFMIRGQLGAWIVGGWYSLKPQERIRLSRALQAALNRPTTRPAQTAPTSRPD